MSDPNKTTSKDPFFKKGPLCIHNQTVIQAMPHPHHPIHSCQKLGAFISALYYVTHNFTTGNLSFYHCFRPPSSTTIHHNTHTDRHSVNSLDTCSSSSPIWPCSTLHPLFYSSFLVLLFIIRVLGIRRLALCSAVASRAVRWTRSTRRRCSAVGSRKAHRRE